MNSHAWRLVKIARSVSKRDPLLGHEFEQNVRSYVAIINPGVKKSEDNIDSTVTVLKSLKEELETMLESMDWDADAAEFAKFFDDAAGAEEEELRRLIKEVRSASTRVSGPMDWIKKQFKNKPKKSDDTAPSGMQPSYRMDDSSMDDFVDGNKDWDSSGSIKEEAKENKDFSGSVQKILDGMDEARKKPSKNFIQGLISQIENAIRHGQNLVKGVYKHLEDSNDSEKKGGGPAGDDSVDVDTSDLDKKNEKLTPELEKTVNTYVDALQKSKGDEKKTIQYLKELFDEAKPLLQYDSVFASVIAASGISRSRLLHIAHQNPALRPALLPILKNRK